jgi:hypothetical protein
MLSNIGWNVNFKWGRFSQAGVEPFPPESISCGSLPGCIVFDNGSLYVKVGIFKML